MLLAYCSGGAAMLASRPVGGSGWGGIAVMAIEWRKISSGDEGIDGAHKHLADISTALDGFCDAEDYDSVSVEVVGCLLDIANYVFGLEQAAMEELGYPKSSEHIEEHEILTSTIEAALGKVKSRSPALMKDAVGTMLFSICGHVETMDVPLADQIFKKIRKPAVTAVRRSADVGRPFAPTAIGGAGRGGAGHAAPAKAAGGSEDGSTLKTIIVSSYASALLDLRVSKGITGDRAKSVAYEIVARAVNKAVGKGRLVR